MKKNTLIVLLKSAVSIGLIFYLFNQVNLADIAQLLQDGNWTFIAMALNVLVTQVFIATTRWRFVLQQQKVGISYKDTLQILWEGLFFSQAMPSSIGGDIIRGYYLKNRGMTIGQATLRVLLDRLFGMVGLILVVLFSLALYIELIHDPVARGGMLLIASVIFFGLSVLFFFDHLPGNFSHLRIIKGFYLLSKVINHCLINII